MANNKIQIDEGTTTNLATNSFTEDAVTKHMQRSVINTSSGTEAGTIANPFVVQAVQATLPLPVNVGNTVTTTTSGTVSIGNIVTVTPSTLALPVNVGNTVTVGGAVTSTQATLPLPVVVNSGTITTTQATLPLPVNVGNTVTTTTSGTVSVGNIVTVTPSTLALPVNVGNTVTVTSSGTSSIVIPAWTPASLTSLGSQATVATVAGRFGGGSFINLNSVPAYLQVFDVAGGSAVTLGVNTPTFVQPIPANSTAANGAAFVFDIDNGITISNGIKVAATTQPTSASVVTTGLTGYVLYRGN